MGDIILGNINVSFGDSSDLEPPGRNRTAKGHGKNYIKVRLQEITYRLIR